jgi:hypothetical protein
LLPEVLEIKPGVGLSQLAFGSNMAEAELAFGKPEETELLDDIDDCQATVWHYWDSGFTLFFDEHDNQHFNCAEIDHPDTVLWGQAIFKLNEKQVIELFKKKGFSRYETEQQEWGEKRLSFDDANIDFYFEKNKLCSINYGRPSANSSILILPN